MSYDEMWIEILGDFFVGFVTLIRAGEAELPLSVTVSSQGTFKTEFTTSQPNMQGNAKSNFNFNANLNNKTAETQLYALMAGAPRGWNVIFRAGGKQAMSAQVEPNTTENISIKYSNCATGWNYSEMDVYWL